MHCSITLVGGDTPATSAPGLGSLLPIRHPDYAHLLAAVQRGDASAPTGTAHRPIFGDADGRAAALSAAEAVAT